MNDVKIIKAAEINYTPKVSVIIPVYNVEPYLRQCLDSVINQTLKDIEIICVDDGSTDNSLSILKEYAQIDNRITVLSQKNCNAGKARNEGLSIAGGEFIAFIDSDDFIKPDIYKSLHNKIMKNNADICICNYEVFDQFSQSVIEINGIYQNFKRDILEVRNDTPVFQLTNPAPWNKLYKASFLKKYNITFQSINSTNDLAFTNLALAMSKKITFVTEPLYYYRINTQRSLTDSKDKNLFCFSDALQDLKQKLVQKNLYEKYRDSFTICALSICFYNLNKVSQNNKTVLKKYLINELFPQFDITQDTVNTVCPKSHQAQFAFLYAGTLPKVSIVLPIYNAEPYLRECLDSVINQTLKNIEIICVNDGSTDNSLNIIKEYALKDIRISYIDKPNAGYGQTMNCGIAAAKGEYVGIVEPDDFIKPDMYETLYTKAKELDLDIVKSDYLQFESINGVYEYKKINIFPDKSYYNRILSPETDEKMLYIMTINPAGIFRRKFLEENNICHNESPGASYQDNGFFIQTMYLASKIYFMDKPFYCYRQDNPNQSIHQKNKVYSVPNEYKFIDTIFEKDKKLNRYKKVYTYRKYIACMWHLIDRLAPEFWEEYINEISKTFKEYMKNGEIDSKYFSEDQWEEFLMLINDHDSLIENVKKLRRKKVISLNCYNLKFLCNRLAKRNANTKRVLIVELNNFHGECLPGFINYFLQLHYEVDVLINENQKKEDPLFIFDDQVDVYYQPVKEILKFLDSTEVMSYDVCFFNSNIIGEFNSKSIMNLIKHRFLFNKILCVEHRLENVAQLQKSATCIVLKQFRDNTSSFMINPHYFGQITEHKRNEKTNFIVVGNIENKRKNYQLLISSVQKLYQKGKSNFKITIIGRGNIGDIPEELRSCFDIKGRLSYPDMYHEMQNADYFLTLLDPENTEHDRYISNGTSGSFQLIYGFKIPCLIANKFAKIHGFNQSNAFVYKDNKDLTSTMLEAINLKDSEYNVLRNNIGILAETISEQSLNNLKKALASPMPQLTIKERFYKMFFYSRKYEHDTVYIFYKLFGCLPFLSKICQTRKSVYKIWGIKFWKIKEEKNGKKIKHFLFGLPILKYKRKNEYTTKIYFMGIPLLKRTEK